MESKIKELEKIGAIINTDYSDYPNPLRELLEYRKMAYSMKDKVGVRTDIESIIEYCEEKLKNYLYL